MTLGGSSQLLACVGQAVCPLRRGQDGVNSPLSYPPSVEGKGRPVATRVPVRRG